MQIDCLVLGEFQTNCYVVRNSAAATECLVIDPGLGAGRLVDFLKQKKLTPAQILLTHGHGDHIAGIEPLKAAFPTLKVGIAEKEAPALADPQLNLSAMFGFPLRLDPPDRMLRPGDQVTLGQLVFEVLSTPGHTPGGLSFYCPAEKVVFTGDALFAGSIGRHDFPGGDLDTLLNGIRAQLFVLPDETVVYSGHGEKTTIGAEKRHNPFF